MGRGVVVSALASVLVLVAVVLCGAAAAAAVRKNCTGPDGGPRDNACVGAVDDVGAGGWPAPNCVNAGSESAPAWRCARCARNCDCDIGDYCVKTPGPSAGRCEPVAGTMRIGATCTEFAPGGPAPRRGVDDAFLCGDAAFSDATSEFLGYNWLGSCSRGACSACAGDAVSHAVALVADVAANATGAGAWGDGGSLLCADRMCDGGAVVPADAAPFMDAFPTAVSCATLALVAAMCLLSLAYCARACVARARNSRQIRELSRVAIPIYDGGNQRLRGLVGVLTASSLASKRDKDH